jgi:hypothetical protein
VSAIRSGGNRVKASDSILANVRRMAVERNKAAEK